MGSVALAKTPNKETKRASGSIDETAADVVPENRGADAVPVHPGESCQLMPSLAASATMIFRASSVRLLPPSGKLISIILPSRSTRSTRSEEHTSELQSP